MSIPPRSAPYDSDVARLILQSTFADQLQPEQIDHLLVEIAPYVERSKRPFEIALIEIAQHYLHDSPLVKALLSDENAPEWEAILTHVINVALRNPLYPEASEASVWPDLDAYADIRAKLGGYNFEGPVHHWINATVAHRIVRYRRDKQALRAGGQGFRHSLKPTKIKRERLYHLSLDCADEWGNLLSETLQAKQPAVDDLVEERCLVLALRAVISELANQKQDPLLLSVWIKHLEQQRKLRDVASDLQLSLGQVARRVTIMRTYLQNHSQVRHWLHEARGA